MLKIIFILFACMIILLSINEWIITGKTQITKIAGWVCAILYCLF